MSCLFLFLPTYGIFLGTALRKILLGRIVSHPKAKNKLRQSKTLHRVRNMITTACIAARGARTLVHSLKLLVQENVIKYLVYFFQRSLHLNEVYFKYI